jgi:RND family efflux transporter MFP subunit
VPVVIVNASEAEVSQEVYEHASVFGVVRARRSSSLAFAQGGRIADVLVEVGERVDEGQRLALLEQRSLDAQRVNVEQDLARANQQLEALSPTIASRENQTQRSRLQQQIAALTSQEAEILRALEQGVITAPYAGIIGARHVDVGESVPSGRPILEIYSAAEPIVELDVAREIAAGLEVGTQVWVSRKTRSVRAEVATKSPILDVSTRTQSITLSVAASAEKDQQVDWTYGEVVEVRMWNLTDMKGIWLPYSALHRTVDGLWSAFVLEPAGEYQLVARRVLEVLLLEDTHALVRGSLKPGDRYIRDGLHRVVPGQRVVGKLVAGEYVPSVPPGAGG